MSKRRKAGGLDLLQQQLQVGDRKAVGHPGIWFLGESGNEEVHMHPSGDEDLPGALYV
jgi:hypothetical protein